MMTLDQFQAFLYKTQNRAFEEKRDKYETVYDKITKKGDSSKADYRDVTGIKLGPLSATNYGGVAYTDEYAAGTERVTKFKKFTIMVVTPEELDTDMYDSGRIDVDKVKFFANMTQDFAESAIWSMEIVTTDLQLRGKSTTATYTWPGAGRDGLALFSASHVTAKGTPVTWSNLQNSAPMSALTLMDGVTMMENIPDETGRPQGVVRRIGIEHGRYWEWRIPELLKSVMQPDTLNLQTVNALLQRKIEWVPILNPYLGASETSWVVKDLDNHESTRFEKQKPTYSKEIDIYTGNRINKCVMRYAIDFFSAKGQVRNDGV
jgi:hypothetical protein